MEGWAYPYPVQMLPFEQDGRPAAHGLHGRGAHGPANGRTVVLFHGKNFGGDYWAGTLRALSAHGYRVIAPDQIGFGKSSKPEMRYTFTLLVDHTTRLLDHLKVERVAVVANSMGGMLGVHFARRHPARVSALVLENPLGLEDYVLSIPAQQTPNLVKLEMAQTPASYRNFVKGYFPTNYKPEFERFVEQFARVQLSGEYPRFATCLGADLPDDLRRPHLSTSCRAPSADTAGHWPARPHRFGRRFAPPEVVKPLGNFPQLGKAAQQRIPGAKLVEFEGVGHVPHLEVPDASTRRCSVSSPTSADRSKPNVVGSPVRVGSSPGPEPKANARAGRTTASSHWGKHLGRRWRGITCDRLLSFILCEELHKRFIAGILNETGESEDASRPPGGFCPEVAWCPPTTSAQAHPQPSRHCWTNLNFGQEGCAIGPPGLLHCPRWPCRTSNCCPACRSLGRSFAWV